MPTALDSSKGLVAEDCFCGPIHNAARAASVSRTRAAGYAWEDTHIRRLRRSSSSRPSYLRGRPRFR